MKSYFLKRFLLKKEGCGQAFCRFLLFLPYLEPQTDFLTLAP